MGNYFMFIFLKDLPKTSNIFNKSDSVHIHFSFFIFQYNFTNEKINTITEVIFNYYCAFRMVPKFKVFTEHLEWTIWKWYVHYENHSMTKHHQNLFLGSLIACLGYVFIIEVIRATCICMLFYRFWMTILCKIIPQLLSIW